MFYGTFGVFYSFFSPLVVMVFTLGMQELFSPIQIEMTHKWNNFCHQQNFAEKDEK